MISLVSITFTITDAYKMKCAMNLSSITSLGVDTSSTLFDMAVLHGLITISLSLLQGNL
jgi:hypothetical protein